MTTWGPIHAGGNQSRSLHCAFGVSEHARHLDWESISRCRLVSENSSRPSYKKEVVDRIEQDEWAEMHTAGARNKARIAEFRQHYLKNDFGANIY
jgi:hypothetical protein